MRAIHTGTGQPLAPFGEGDRVSYRDENGTLRYALVLECTHDACGWEVFVLPEQGDTQPFGCDRKAFTLDRRSD